MNDHSGSRRPPRDQTSNQADNGHPQEPKPATACGLMPPAPWRDRVSGRIGVNSAPAGG